MNFPCLFLQIAECDGWGSYHIIHKPKIFTVCLFTEKKKSLLILCINDIGKLYLCLQVKKYQTL